MRGVWWWLPHEDRSGGRVLARYRLDKANYRSFLRHRHALPSPLASTMAHQIANVYRSLCSLKCTVYATLRRTPGSSTMVWQASIHGAKPLELRCMSWNCGSLFPRWLLYLRGLLSLPVH